VALALQKSRDFFNAKARRGKGAKKKEKKERSLGGPDPIPKPVNFSCLLQAKARAPSFRAPPLNFNVNYLGPRLPNEALPRGITDGELAWVSEGGFGRAFDAKNVQKKFKKALTGNALFAIVPSHTVTHNYKTK
jgi:hypothetical protein